MIGVSLGLEHMNNNHLAPRGHLHGVGRALVLVVLLTPWIFGYSDSHAAIVNHIAFAAAFGPAVLLTGVLRPAARWLLLGAVWLVVSPWLLGYAGDHSAWIAELGSGLVLILISVSTLLRD